MDALRKGCRGTRVAQLQEALKKKGYPVTPDGVFGQQTQIAVLSFQKENGLTVDGIAGKETWNAIVENKISNTVKKQDTSPSKSKDSVSAQANTAVKTAADTVKNSSSTVKTADLDYSETVKLLKIEESAIRAVCEVESGGRTGFFKDNRPVILFEGHIFWRELQKRNIDPERYKESYSDVLFPKWDKSKYKGGAAEYDRMNKAATIDEEAALCSASWGMFQIMGFNHKLCGYDSIREYVNAMKSSSENHLLAFAHFLKNTGIDKFLHNLDWEGFAAKYNGPGYKQNRYDEKLQAAYLKYKKQIANG
jgi:hypothetical protein